MAAVGIQPYECGAHCINNACTCLWVHPSSVLLLFVLRISALGCSRNESRKLGRSSSLLDRQEQVVEYVKIIGYSEVGGS